MFDLRNQVAIVGVGETDYSHNSGRSELTLTLQAIRAALDDCGLRPHDVDGLLRWAVDSTAPTDVAVNLGLPDLAFHSEVSEGGGPGGGLVAHACAAIAGGLAKVVVIYRGMNGRSGRRYGRGDVMGRQGRGEGAFSEPFGLLTPQHSLALLIRRRMHETGVTSRQFGAVAVTTRRHANRNPRAYFHARRLTLAEHQQSRYVVEPLRLYDCCLETDGAGAIVLTSAARAPDLRQRPAFVSAAVQGSATTRQEYTDTAAVQMAPRLFRMAGLGPAEIGVAQIYDHFSPFVLFALEDYGFVRRGEGGPFAEAGEIAWPDGRLPVNTSGGHLSEAYLQGMNHLIEGVRQIRGSSTAQVADVGACLIDTGYGAVILSGGAS